VTPDGGSQSPAEPERVDQLPVLAGITTPVLTLVPDAHAAWEVDGSIDDVVAVARAADRLGYHHVTCAEHVIVPTDVAAVRGGRYWDPLASFGYLAALTSQVRLATNVLVLGYHHPLDIAKRYGTLDQVSGGRLILGLGVGTLEEEFDLLGFPFDDRGERADDALCALRASLSDPRPEYDGAYYRFAGVVMDPCARQASVPLWIGGRTARSLRRAVELGDGWAPFGIKAVDVVTMLDAARATPAWSARRRPLDVVLRNGRPLDPLSDPDGARASVDRLLSAGATGLQLWFVHDSVPHYLEQLEAMAGLLRQP
jgi:probable F420-dependent oxidoreductase